jgi:hypothetical protein
LISKSFRTGTFVTAPRYGCDAMVAKPSTATVIVGIGLAAGSRLAETVYQVASRM